MRRISLIVGIWFAGLVFSAGSALQSTGRVTITDTDGKTVEHVSLVAAFRAIRTGEMMRIDGRHVVVPAYEGGLGELQAPLQLRDRKNIVIQGGAGAEIVGEGSGDFLALEGCEHVRIENLAFRGNRPPVEIKDGLFTMILLRGTNRHVAIRRCRFQDFGDHAVSHLWSPKLSTHVEVADCLFENGGAKDVPVLGVDGAAVSGIGSFWRVERCQVINCYRGFEIENSGSNVIEHVRIANNTLTGVADLGVMLFASNGDGSLFRDINITGNTFADFHSSDPACSATAIRLAGGRRIRIQNNTVTHMGRQGIVVVSDVEVSDLKISGNVVSGAGNHGIAVHRLESTIANVSITANNVSDCSEAGIRVIDCADVLVSGNLCYNNGRLSEAGGIELFGGDTTRALVNGNKCYDSQPVRTQAYGVYIGPGVSGAMIRDNYSPDGLHTHAGIQDLGDATDLGGSKTTTPGFFDEGVLTSAALVNAPLEASIGVRSDGVVTLTWQPLSSLTYRVEYKDSLVSSAWSQLTNFQATAGSAATVFDSIGANRNRYYRIREIVPPFRPLGGSGEPPSGR